jgi:amidase
LHGVPFTLKDCHATAGMRTTAGSPPLADHVPEEDGTVAQRLKAAGGILLGKTNVSVLLADIQSHNPIFGRTNNPWRLERTPGGSSGGSAAALAAGMTPFEIGSDIGGSIRIPSHYCGLYGLKPTENRVSHFGHIPGLPGVPRSVRLMASIGPMARSAGDLALLFGLIAGPDGRDVQVPPIPAGEPPRVELQDLRVAFAETFPGVPVAAAVAQAVRELARELEPLCAAVEEAVPPGQDFAAQAWRGRQLTGMITGAFGPEEDDPPVSLAQYLEALHQRDEAIVAWESFFGEWDVLLCPPSMVTAFAHCETESPLQVDGQTVDYWSANAHCKLFNYSGHPAAVLPHKVDGQGLPVGIQIAGKRWSETRLLAIVEALSEVTGDFRRPPGYE